LFHQLIGNFLAAQTVTVPEGLSEREVW